MGTTKILKYNQESINFLRSLEEHVNKAYTTDRNSTAKENTGKIKELQRRHVGWTMISFEDDFVTKLTEIRLNQAETNNEEEKIINEIDQYLLMLSLLDNIFYGYPSERSMEDCNGKPINNHLNNWVRTFYHLTLINNKAGDDVDKKKAHAYEIQILIKDFISIPKDFASSYFGYDTGISGLNQLLMGGFLLPEDSTAMITVDGESGVGKTTFVVNLVCAILKNCGDTVFKHNRDTIIHKHAERLPIFIDYFILEQSYNNIKRCITNFNLLPILKDTHDVVTANPIDPKDTVYYAEELDGLLNICQKNSRKLVMSIHPVPMCSAADLLQQVQKCEEPFQAKSVLEDRHIIVIDSINAVLDMDIEQSKWRQVLQALRSILGGKKSKCPNEGKNKKENNTILILTQEKDPSKKDTMVEYFCDVVMGFEKKNINGEYLRYIELIESRFQDMCFGRHPFHFSTKGQASFGIYPSASALMELIPNQLKQIQPDKKTLEFGIKIDGILKFFVNTHLKNSGMKPYFLKNSVSNLNGEKGCNKSAFSKFFTLSSYRDERWISMSERAFENDLYETEVTDKECYHEMNYSEKEADKIWNEIKEMKPYPKSYNPANPSETEKHCNPIDKAIGMIVKFGENYEENEHDVVIDAPWGKVIIPANALKVEPKFWGRVSDVICHFEVKNFSEEYYLEQIMDVIRAIESYHVYEEIPKTFENLLRRMKLSRILWEKTSLREPEVEATPNNVEFSPSFAIYKDKDYINDNSNVKVEDRNIYNSSIFFYHESLPIKVRRLVLDNTENLIDIFKQIDAQDFITTITHFGLAKGITILIVNQVGRGSRNQINDICNAIADNIFEFQREYFCGGWYSVLHIKRSSNSWHNRMYYNIYKRHDELLELQDTFSFISSFHNELKELIPIRLFLPGKSQAEIDMYANLSIALNPSNRDFPDMNYSIERDKRLPYKDSHEQWHTYLKEMIIYSMTHPQVEVIKASDPFTDISIIIEDESVKDALTISCIPGHLIKRYKTNLLRLTDFINFSPRDNQLPFIDNAVDFIADTWMEIGNLNSTTPNGRFGKTHYYLKPSSLQFISNESNRDNCHFSWIEPDLLFNPVIDISHHSDSDVQTAHALAYPFYINPRFDLIIRHKDAKDAKDDKVKYHFGSTTTEDYFTFFMELLFKNRSIRNSVAEFISNASESSIGYQINDIPFAQKDTEDITNHTFISRNWFSSHQQFIDILKSNLSPEEFSNMCFKYIVPKVFSYSTWYLGVPLNSPRKDRACEIIVKMTEYHDLANFQLNGIGIQLGNYAFRDECYKYYPHLAYHEILTGIGNIHSFRDNANHNSTGIPLASMDCFYELITPIGGLLQNVHQMLKSTMSSCPLNSDLISRIIGQITNIFTAYTSDNLCNECYFNYLTNINREKLSRRACDCWLGALFGLVQSDCPEENNC